MSSLFSHYVWTTQGSVPGALARILKNSVSVTPDGRTRRKFQFGQPRPYDSSKRQQNQHPPPTPQPLHSKESIISGTMFAPHKRGNDYRRSCCLKFGCNEKFSDVEMRALRMVVPELGPSKQHKKMAYVQDRLRSPDQGRNYRLELGWSLDRNFSVCVNFFVAVTGMSRTLVSHAQAPGAHGMQAHFNFVSRDDSPYSDTSQLHTEICIYTAS